MKMFKIFIAFIFGHEEILQHVKPILHCLTKDLGNQWL